MRNGWRGRRAADGRRQTADGKGKYKVRSTRYKVEARTGSTVKKVVKVSKENQQ